MLLDRGEMYYSLSIPIEARSGMEERGYTVIDSSLSDSECIILLPKDEPPLTTVDRFPLLIDTDRTRCIDPCCLIVVHRCQTEFHRWCSARGYSDRSWRLVGDTTPGQGSGVVILLSRPFDMTLERYAKEIRDQPWCERVEYCLIDITTLFQRSCY